MSNKKLFTFDGIDLYLKNNNLLFVTDRGGECEFDPIQDIFIYDTTDKYNKIFIDCFINDNEDNLADWKEKLKTNEFSFRDTL